MKFELSAGQSVSVFVTSDVPETLISGMFHSIKRFETLSSDPSISISLTYLADRTADTPNNPPENIDEQ